MTWDRFFVFERAEGKLRGQKLKCWLSTCALREGRNLIWFMWLALFENDFRFINLSIKREIYCIRKEFPASRAKVIIQSVPLPFSGIKRLLMKDESIGSSNSGGRNPICAPIIVNFNLHMTRDDDDLSELTLPRLIYSLSRKMCFFPTQKCTRKPNEMEKLFSSSASLTCFHHHTSTNAASDMLE